MKGNIKLDNTDKKILEILQKNSNITNAQLAKEIGLSPAPTLERVNNAGQTAMDLAIQHNNEAVVKQLMI